jgi:hypothetical protein
VNFRGRPSVAALALLAGGGAAVLVAWLVVHGSPSYRVYVPLTPYERLHHLPRTPLGYDSHFGFNDGMRIALFGLGFLAFGFGLYRWATEYESLDFSQDEDSKERYADTGYTKRHASPVGAGPVHEPLRPYHVNIRSTLHKIRRALTPPGSRGSLDTSYRQPNIDGTNIPSEGSHAQAVREI